MLLECSSSAIESTDAAIGSRIEDAYLAPGAGLEVPRAECALCIRACQAGSELFGLPPVDDGRRHPVTGGPDARVEGRP